MLLIIYSSSVLNVQSIYRVITFFIRKVRFRLFDKKKIYLYIFDLYFIKDFAGREIRIDSVTSSNIFEYQFDFHFQLRLQSHWGHQDIVSAWWLPWLPIWFTPQLTHSGSSFQDHNFVQCPILQGSRKIWPLWSVLWQAEELVWRLQRAPPVTGIQSSRLYTCGISI